MDDGHKQSPASGPEDSIGDDGVGPRDALREQATADTRAELSELRAAQTERVPAARGVDSPETVRGVGDVLLVDGVPRKVVAPTPDVAVRDVESQAAFRPPPAKLRAGHFYFVFDENERELLVGQFADRDVAWGWVRSDQVHDWNTNSVVLDENGGVREYVQQQKPDGATLVSANTGKTRTVSRRVLAGTMAKYVNEYALTEALSSVTLLAAGLETASRRPPELTAAACREFLRRFGYLDFLDVGTLCAVEDVVENVPKPQDGFRERANFRRKTATAISLLKQQTILLERLAPEAFYRPELQGYVIPVEGDRDGGVRGEGS